MLFVRLHTSRVPGRRALKGTADPAPDPPVCPSFLSSSMPSRPALLTAHAHTLPPTHPPTHKLSDGSNVPCMSARADACERLTEAAFASHSTCCFLCSLPRKDASSSAMFFFLSVLEEKGVGMGTYARRIETSRARADECACRDGCALCVCVRDWAGGVIVSRSPVPRHARARPPALACPTTHTPVTPSRRSRRCPCTRPAGAHPGQSRRTGIPGIGRRCRSWWRPATHPAAALSGPPASP